MSNKYVKALTVNFDVLQEGSCIRFQDGSKIESSTIGQTGFPNKASVTLSAAVSNPVDLGMYRLYSTPGIVPMQDLDHARQPYRLQCVG